MTLILEIIWGSIHPVAEFRQFPGGFSGSAIMLCFGTFWFPPFRDFQRFKLWVSEVPEVFRGSS